MVIMNRTIKNITLTLKAGEYITDMGSVVYVSLGILSLNTIIIGITLISGLILNIIILD